MVFASPLWLIALLPWAGLVAYLLPGRGLPAVVPFVSLWKGSAIRSKRPARRFPDLSMLFMLIALLLVVLAAADPMVRSSEVVNGDVTIILDRGATMASPSKSGEPFRGAARHCAERFPIAADSRVRLLPVPGQEIETGARQWMGMINRLPATVIRVDLDQIISRRLRQTAGPIVVLSDQQVHRKDPRVVQILPDPPADDVAITAFSVRATPRPQAMIRLENHSDLKSVHLSIASAVDLVDRDEPIQMRGQSKLIFVDLKRVGTTVSAMIQPLTPANPWAIAYLVQNDSGIQLLVDLQLDDSVKRMVAVYSRDRTAGSNQPKAIVSNRELEAGQLGVWIASASGRGGGLAEAPTVVPSEVTRNVVNWPSIGDASVPYEFSPIVSTGRGTIVAVRESPARQVWLNAGLFNWEKTADFVIFFGNVFDWISSGDRGYRSIAAAELGDGWTTISSQPMPANSKPGEWPGIYQSETGQTAAVNGGEYPTGRVAAASFKQRVFSSPGRSGFRLNCIAVFAALGSLLGGLICWRQAVSGNRGS